MNTTAAVASHLRTLREARGWSVSELARRSDVAKSHIHNIENGAKSPTLALLDRLAVAFGLTLQVMMMPNYQPPSDGLLN